MTTYFVPPPDLAAGTKARSSDINAMSAAVNSAFAKLPDEMLLKSGTLNYAVDTSTSADQYIVSISPSVTTYTDGLMVRMRPTRDNLGPASINVNGMGPVAIKRLDGIDVQAGDILKDATVALSYVAANNAFVLPNLAGSQVKQSAANATAAAASATAAAGSASTASGAATAAGNSATAAATSASAAAASASAVGKDASNGTAGLTGFSINLKNAAGSVISKLSSIASAVRTWTFPDKSGTVALLSDLMGFRNRLINGNFAVNQRAVSGTVTLAAGVYGHDRWKAGAGGCTYTFASNGCDTTITITAGSLVQIVKGVNVEGGVYTLSNGGTAQARVGINGAAPSGSYAAAPFNTASANAGQSMTVEFSTGTITGAQLEPGPAPSTYERRPYHVELGLCQAYYRRWGVATGFISIASGFSYSATNAAVTLVSGEMQATPQLAYSNIACFNANGTQIAADAALANYQNGVAHLIITVASGMTVGQGNQLAVGLNNGQPGFISLTAEL